MAKINLSHNLLGCRFDNWLRLKRSNPITDKKQARLITAVTFVLGLPALLEWLIFYIPIRRTKVKEGPVYIVGYWRSGTTFLQNLLTRDPQFGWFDPVKTVTFSNCILLKHMLAKIQKRLLKGARPMDNLEYELDLPMEEVFAQATISTQAISHMLVFPDGGNGAKYMATAFIDEQDEEKQREWRKAYDYILRKVTWLYHGRPLLLKSPENTCRIAELKRCYPKAKFINIYRNPYKVIMSTINMFTKEMELLSLNEPAPREVIEDLSIELFEHIYRKAFVELYDIPEEDRIDIKYEDFCRNPEGYVKQIYTHLGLGGFEEAKPYFEKYLESQKDYQKNTFTLDPVLRDKINSRLGFYFEQYGYEMITE
ncbi:MAG: sulfotransferase [Lachnospiraceae bacterium]|nr:sulfotransferase [Lachnospiraceae bacterium]